MDKLLNVNEITGLIKAALENSFDDVYVVGELSNFKKHISGHWYFTLKDSDAQINCTMWKGINNFVFFTPQDGMKVIVRGRVTVYPPRGSYQLDVRSMKTAGVGELQLAFERLKKKLAEEGLFDNQFKKPIPKFPERIGIVTAIGGAAFRDMISVAKRRCPMAELVIAPAKVQGEGAAVEIARSIEELNKKENIDVIIVGRGGGSLEDLWAFNEEVVARAIFDSKIPIISGVGHEVDYTIADFTADMRAPTPSAAMELATPDRKELFAFIEDFSYYTKQKISEIITDKKEEVLRLVRSYGFRAPQDIIKHRSQYLDNLYYRFQNKTDALILKNRHDLEVLSGKLELHNSGKILKKGYALIRQNGAYVMRAETFNGEKGFKVKFFDKEVEVGSYEK